VAVLEVVAILLALTMLAMLPCLVIVVIFADAFLNTMRRQRQRGLLRRAAQEDPAPSSAPLQAVAAAADAPDEGCEAAGPPLEQIAAEIHRLTHARRSSSAGTARFIAATRAYDRRLGHACRALEIDDSIAALRRLSHRKDPRRPSDRIGNRAVDDDAGVDEGDGVRPDHGCLIA